MSEEQQQGGPEETPPGLPPDFLNVPQDPTVLGSLREWWSNWLHSEEDGAFGNNLRRAIKLFKRED